MTLCVSKEQGACGEGGESQFRSPPYPGPTFALAIMAAEDVAATGADPSELEGGGLLHEIFTSPLNLLLLVLCIFLLYEIVRGDQPTASDSDDDEPPPLPRLQRRDFTPAELRRFDGVQDPASHQCFQMQCHDFLESVRVTIVSSSLLPVKYHHVGKLLKEGEERTVYSDEEEPKDESAGKND
ncbi:membrane-associated progesterone receptor component 1-like [Physeter macrocephalus]|uniref:Membrane-associated progesterone receptor component 1-like n=1 Tax=Physeter macrocephalus TaxID=9755 RepID=A0A9W2X4N9_PHYMC|nr:membrane-associated progesterone receptor component 1-like [Physeter catodon]